MLLEKQSWKRISSFVLYNLGGKFPGLILQGEKGIGKRMAADYIACQLLGVRTESLKACPDYTVVESNNGSILLEQLDELKRKVLISPAVSKYKIFVIDDADMMNTNCQNSLLKLIEEGYATNVFIFVAHKPLLDTIHSRCETIKVRKPDYDDVDEYFRSSSEQMDTVMMKIADNKIGLYYSLIDDSKYVDECKDIISCFLNMKNRREILEMFGQIKEKDSKNFYEAYPVEKVQMFIRYIKNIFIELLWDALGLEFFNYSIKRFFSIEKCIEVIQDIDVHLEKMGNKGRYTKNDFFDLVRLMAS